MVKKKKDAMQEGGFVPFTKKPGGAPMPPPPFKKKGGRKSGQR